MAKSRTLNEKEAKFCEFYVASLNASLASRQAGYSQKLSSSHVNGHVLLKRDHVRAYIDELIVARRERCKISSDQVIDYLAADAFKHPPGEVELTEGRRQSLRLLGLHLGLFTEKHEISGPGGSPIAFTMQEMVNRIYGLPDDDGAGVETADPE